MGIVETVKDVAILVQKADNIELQKKIMELQVQIMTVLEENHSLRSQVRDLNSRMEFQGSLKFRNNMYYRASEDGAEDGPFCSKCWDVQHTAVRLQTLRDGTKFCPGCQKSAPGTGR